MATPIFLPAWIIPRRIGPIYPDITVSEEASDELYITQHPVEQGAAITDHAYKKPATVVIRAGVSNSSFSAGYDPNYSNYIYGQLLELQNNREPFDIVTGKRYYQNMLMSGLRQITNSSVENALLYTALCQQIILVTTQVVTLASPADQQDPSKTGATQRKGQQSLVPATGINTSALPAGVPQ